MSTKDFSSKQEKMIADYLGWKVVAGSGAAACHPGDIIGDDWLGECKTHEKSNHSIFFSSQVWDKICNEAAIKHRNPVLFTDDGSQKIDKTWCIINHFCIPSDYNSIVYPKTFKKNITLSHDKLQKFYESCNSYTFCIAALGDRKVCILPLELFNEVFI